MPNDPAIDHPDHYQSAGRHDADDNLEAIDVIETYGCTDSFHLGSALKYMLRAGKKGDARVDLEKARWYVQRFLSHIDDGGPVASETALDDMPPDEVVAAFGLTDTVLGQALDHLLHFCALSTYEIADLLPLLDDAIAEVSRSAKPGIAS